MISSQLLSAFLCIGCLLFIANGFTTIRTPTSRMTSSGPSYSDVTSQPDPFHNPQSRADRRNVDLHAAKATSKSSASSSSDQVKEMAAFLSVQLLEKVMAETMKPEGESKIDLEVVERITKALQMSSQPSSDASTTPAEETTINEEKTKVIADIPVSAPSETTKTGVDDTPLPTSEDDDISSSTAEMDTLEKPTIEAKDETNVTKEQETVDETPPSSPSIPEIKVKALEVVESNMPALRPESVPQRRPETEEVTDATEPIEGSLVEEISSETSEGVAENAESSEEAVDTSLSSSSEEAVDTSLSSSSEEIDTSAILEREKAEESFHRRLLKQKLEYDTAREIRIENEKNTIEEDEKVVDVTSLPPVEVTCDEETEEENDGDSSFNTVPSEKVQTASETLGFPDSTESKQDTKEDVEEPTQGESDDANTAVLSEPMEAKDEEPPPPTAATTQLAEISERRVETIVALRQPKSTDDESKLAEKYAQMSLEDRAYAVLCDLGMIEERINPDSPSYDHSNDGEYCEQRFLPLL